MWHVFRVIRSAFVCLRTQVMILEKKKQIAYGTAYALIIIMHSLFVAFLCISLQNFEMFLLVFKINDCSFSQTTTEAFSCEHIIQAYIMATQCWLAVTLLGGRSSKNQKYGVDICWKLKRGFANTNRGLNPWLFVGRDP